MYSKFTGCTAWFCNNLGLNFRGYSNCRRHCNRQINSKHYWSHTIKIVIIHCLQWEKAMLNQLDVLSKKYVIKNKVSFLWTPVVLVILFYSIISTERFNILGFGVQAYLDLFLFAVIILAISYFRIQALVNWACLSKVCRKVL